MGKVFKSVAIQGARSHDRAHLAAIARYALTRDPPGSIGDAINALLETGLVIEAHCVKERNGSFVFRVEESPKLRSVEIDGNEQVGVNAIRGVIQTKVDKLLNARTVAADTARIANLYQRSGHPKPEVRVIRESEGKKTANLRFVINEKDRLQVSNDRPSTHFRRKKRRRPATNSADPWMPDEPSSGVEGHDGPLDDRDNAPDPVSHDREDHFAVEGGNKAPPTTSGGASNSIVAEIAAYTSSWSGRFTVEDHIRIIRVVAPRAMNELSVLIEMVEARRFNDQKTQDALDLLRALHHDLGLLIDAVENAKFKSLLVRIARKNEKLKRLIGLGAKVGLVAPALTVGISHMMSAITQVPIDSTMISTVFATMVAMPLVENQIAGSARKAE